jgi:DNA-binding NarL/FixJ family response regulator
MPGTVKIFIIDDHQMFIDGIKALLKGIPGVEIAGESTSGKMACEMIRQVIPDIVLMDLGLPDLNGIELTEIIRKELPTVKVVALTMYDDTYKITGMIRAGAKAYVLKNTSREELLDAIRVVAAGGVYFPGEVWAKGMEKLDQHSSTSLSLLTERETEIIRLIAKSFTNKEIANQLCISELTVNTHRKNAMRKLSLKNTAALVKFVIDNNF